MRPDKSDFQVTNFFSCSEECGEVLGDKFQAYLFCQCKSGSGGLSRTELLLCFAAPLPKQYKLGKHGNTNNPICVLFRFCDERIFNSILHVSSFFASLIMA